MRKVLITGGAGFIGANFVLHWAEKYPDDKLVVIDALTYAGNINNLSSIKERGTFRFVEGDICDTELVEDILRKEKIETVVHFAAESHVDRSITGPDAFVTTNIIGTHSLLKAARCIWLDENKGEGKFRFHHVSTDEVYGTLKKDDPAFTELTPYAPNSPYSASKASSDHLVRAYYETYNLPITISNCSNNYGPFQFPEKLIPVIILNALAGKPLPIYGDGENVRDWLFVEDHCIAIMEVIEKGSIGETYNIGGVCELTNLQLVKKICNILDKVKADSLYTPHESLISFVKDRPGHDRRYAIDIRKINSELDWFPSYNIDQGLDRTVRWYLNNPDWCKSCIDKLS